MSLLTADNTTDKIDYGSATVLDNVGSTVTILTWIYFTSVANVVRAIGGCAGGTQGILWFQRGADGTTFRFQGGRSGGPEQVDATTGTLSANVWSCLGLRWQAGTTMSIHCGTLTNALTDRSDTPTFTSGTHDHSGGAWSQGCYGTTNCGAHRHGPIAIFNRILSVGEMQSWQFRPRVLSGCVLFAWPGHNGTTSVADWSGNGNTGSITGATLAPDVPLGPWFGSDMARPYGVSPVVIPAYSVLLGEPTIGASVF